MIAIKEITNINLWKHAKL